MTGSRVGRDPVGPGAGGAGQAAAAPAARRYDLRFVLLAAAVALEAVGLGVLFPLLAHIQHIHHLPTYSLGLMSGGSFFAALAAQVVVGPFLDGAKAHRMLLAGLLLAGLALVWFAQAGDLWQLVAARAVGGIGYGIVGPASLREASVGVDGERRGARLGVLSSSMMAGIVVGPLVGSVLYTAGGVRLPFEVVAAMIGVIFVATALVPPRRSDPRPAGGSPRAKGLSGLPLAPVVAVLVLGAALQLPNGLYDALWSRLLTDRGASELLIGLSLSLFGLPFVLLAPLGGRIAERRGPLLAAAAGLLVADGFMASYGFVPSPVVITLLGVAEACVQAVAVPGGYAAVARVFPDDRAATGQGWFGGSGTAAAGAAAVISAPAYGVLGSGAVFAGGAGVSALLVVVAVVVGRGGVPAGGGGGDGRSGGGSGGGGSGGGGRVGPPVSTIPTTP